MTGNAGRSSHPTKRRSAVCPYCGVGCRVTAEVEGSRIVRIAADKAAAPNFGMLCQKGALLGDAGVWDERRRLLEPMIRRTRAEPLQAVTWNQAASFIAERIAGLRREGGNDAVGFYGSGQLDTEASYLFTKLFKGFLGTNCIDSNSRLCMSSAVSAYVKAFGSDGPPTCYDDIRTADLMLIVGANMSANHPVLTSMIARRRGESGASKGPTPRVIVVDPRRTATAALADEYIAVAPGGDVALFTLVARRLIERGAIDQPYIERSTTGFDAYEASLTSHDESALLDRAGVSEADVAMLADAIAGSRAMLSFYCQGLNQSVHGVDNNLAIIHLHLLTGQLGRPGAGPFSLTGQPNAMGGREVGYLSHQLPGYRFVSDASDRAEVERLWRTRPGTICFTPGPAAVELYDRLNDGRMRGIWIACTNPVASMPNANRVRQGLRRADLVIHQDCYHPTETGQFADVLLPAAQWGEKTGTMTNSERLVSRSEKLFDPPGQAMPDWWIAARIGRAMGFERFDYVTSDEVWDEVRELLRGRPCDVYGMTNARLRGGPLHWPCPDAAHGGEARRYTDGVFATADGRARFHTLAIADPSERTDGRSPLVLTTGRVASQWHTRTRTSAVERLNEQEPDTFIEVHPDDAAALGIENGTMVRITGDRGAAEAPARVTAAIRRGAVFVPFHWADLHGVMANINAVTSDAIDPISRQPALKYAAVRIEAAVPVEPAMDPMPVPPPDMEATPC